MSEKKYIKALEVREDLNINPGHAIKLYGNETIVKGFYVSYNDALEKWETIILTEGRGDPFERSLSDIEILEDQYQLPSVGPIWVKASDRLPIPNKHLAMKFRNQYYGAYYNEDHKMIYSLLTHHYWSTADLETMGEIEWLDESGCEAKKALEGNQGREVTP